MKLYEGPGMANKEDNIKSGMEIDVWDKKLSCECLLHWHNYYELELILEGSARHYINNERLELLPGNCYLLTPGDLHRIIPNENIHLISIKFTDLAINRAVYDLICHNYSYLNFYLNSCITEHIKDDFLYILMQKTQKDTAYEAAMSATLERILIELIRLNEKTSQAKADTPINKADQGMYEEISYLHYHFKESISLNDVAHIAHLSPNYFSSCFHYVTGQTFQKYLLALRLDFASKLIATTDMPITEVSLLSGFNSLSYFLKIFKQKYKHSPKQHRSFFSNQIGITPTE